MAQTAKLFVTGRSQAMRLPLEYRFEGTEVFIRRDPMTQDGILSRRPELWDDFFSPEAMALVPDDFMSPADCDQGSHDRDPFDSPAM